jgi:hypothetical protein
MTASPLFAPITLGGATLANRIAVSPMCQYSAVAGSATDWHLQHLGSLSLSSAGMLVLEATAVEPAVRITPRCLRLYSDANEAALAPAMPAARHRPRSRGKVAARWAPAKAHGKRWPLRRSRSATTGRCPRRSTRQGSTASVTRSSMPRGAPTAWASTSLNCMERMDTCCITSSRRSLTSAPTATVAATPGNCPPKAEVVRSNRIGSASLSIFGR